MSSFSHSSQIFFLLCIFVASTLQIHARESKFFIRATPYEQLTSRPEVAQVEKEEFMAPFSDFNETTQSSGFKKTPMYNLNGHGLYGQETEWFPTEQRNQGPDHVEEKQFIPSNSFNETTQLPLFKEISSPSQNENGTLYGQERKKFPTNGNITTTAELEKQPTTEDYSLFKRESTNQYDEENFGSKDLNSEFSGYEMGGTKTMEKDYYFYDVKNEYGRNGFPYGSGTGGARHGYHYRGVNPSEDEKRYGSYGRSYDNENAYYEPNNYYLQGNQEEEDSFLP